MKHAFRRILAFMLVFVMIAGLGITAFAEGGKAAENAELFEDISPYREGEVFTYPMKEGKVFGGWYTDAALTKTLGKETRSGPAYAKWVDANVLTVKWQITDGTTAESEKTNLRLLTTVDTLKYDSVGFHSDVYGKVEGGREFTSTTVYKKIKSAENGEIVANDPTVFSPESTRFMTFSLTRIPQNYYDQIMVVTPFWWTMDGTKVLGTPKDVRISEEWEETESVAFKADGECLYELDAEKTAWPGSGTTVDGASMSDTSRVKVPASYVDMLFGTVNAAGEFTEAITSDNAENTLLLGLTEDPASLEALSQIEKDEWIICQIDGKLVVTGWFDNATVAAARVLYALAAGSDNVTLKLPMKGKLSDYTIDIPDCEVGTFAGGFDGDEGIVVFRYIDVESADFDAYADAMLAAGYTLYQENELASYGGQMNRFKTFVKDDKLVHIYFVPSGLVGADQSGMTQAEINGANCSFRPDGNELRIITDLAEYAAPNETANTYTDAGITPKLSTLNLYDKYDDGNNIGQCQIFTLADGSFIVYDGGLALDAMQVYHALEQLNERKDGKIVVAAWIFTHGHNDHVNAFHALADTEYAAQIELERLVCNPAADTYSWRSLKDPYGYALGLEDIHERKLQASIDKFGGDTQIIHPHMGQKLYLRNAVVEVLYSVDEDLYPVMLNNSNDSSLITRVWLGGQKTLMLGDAAKDTAISVLIPLFSEVLKDNEIMQVAHHGLGGISSKFYPLTDATIAIWTTTQSTYEAYHTNIVHKYIEDPEKNYKMTVVNDRYLQTLELPFDPDEDAVRKQIIGEYLGSNKPVATAVGSLEVGYPNGLSYAASIYVRDMMLDADMDILALIDVSAADAQELAMRCGYPFCSTYSGNALLSRYTVESEQDGHCVLITEDVETDVYFTPISGTFAPVGDNRYILLASGLGGDPSAVQTSLNDPSAKVLFQEEDNGNDAMVISARIDSTGTSYQDAASVQGTSGLTNLGSLAAASLNIGRKTDPIVPIPEGSFQVADWWCNYRNSSANKQKVADYLFGSGFGVVTLEMLPRDAIGSDASAAAFAELCGYPYYSYVVSDPDTYFGTGHMVLSKYPLTVCDPVVLTDYSTSENEGRMFGHVIAAVDEQQFDIYYGINNEGDASQIAAVCDIAKQTSAETGRPFIINGYKMNGIASNFESGAADVFIGEYGSITASSGIAMSGKNSLDPRNYDIPYGAIDYINTAVLTFAEP